MILRPDLSPRHHAMVARPAAAEPVAAVPGWLRRAVAARGFGPDALADVALTAGAAIGALDAVVRGQARSAGASRQRLALAAAAVTARQAGRVEDEAALRDAVLLTRPGDDVGPAGRMLLGWRRLADTAAQKLLTKASIAGVLEELGHALSDTTISALAKELQQLAAGTGMAEMLIGAFALAEREGLARAVGCWFADALLGQRLGWAHAMPLLGTEAALGTAPRRREVAAARAEAQGDRVAGLLAAQARAALRAIDVSAETGRRADKLLAVAPKLRAKASSTVVERLLCDDSIVASEQIAGMSDRGLRRLFDRLVELDAVRELSGRPTFRIYGL